MSSDARVDSNWWSLQKGGGPYAGVWRPSVRRGPEAGQLCGHPTVQYPSPSASYRGYGGGYVKVSGGATAQLT
ncbi:predicted protein [Pyrenophora tritici-repentis Pt-1C-BFP]|uniref:Uncharacterized protein n=1 Tax=Pyrenophora tritici-repentis (strain Pt-1C-BFP) TaxID=426418 RepID=B2WMX2_PYRTR|nr:uncharacterized protein PTRG_11332 [Pyrenophora tritici-repentis Pt-1C-BFP]EDU44382.1 predicted protein [Pyrenophora tritici-repentis Pt-1C-BFP]